MDVIDYYLLEYDYFNPFIIIVMEGIFGFCLTGLILIIEPDLFFTDVDKLSKTSNTPVLVILLVLYFIFSGMKNVYKVLTLKFFSSMTRGLSECFLDPFIFIYIFFKMKNQGKDKNESSENIWYFFVINLICEIIVTFCTCIYNEFLVLYNCGMAYNTHLEIIRRSNILDALNDDNDSSSFSQKGNYELFEKN